MNSFPQSNEQRKNIKKKSLYNLFEEKIKKMPRKKPKCFSQKQRNQTKQKRLTEKQYDQQFDEFHDKRPKILPIDMDLPGDGQFFCKACSNFYQDQLALDQHHSSKQHKRFVAKLNKEEPYRGSDLPVDNGPKLGRGQTANKNTTSSLTGQILNELQKN
eukprot:TRINITY_DN4687_c0_g1_i1.p1 TRINITY_DN4687_c0_g1~~TRINITY_DN4687_c0_g1_i1.p1  ORF type:complete len:159 (+),score=41.73 TRINITY_DN4687_c0_g1_i1:173-649(+)